jgi:hypothetical protein
VPGEDVTSEEMLQRYESRPTTAIPMKQVRSIARRFDLPEPFEISDFPWKGNVNYSTYLVTAGPPGSRFEYLLQNLNADVFAYPGAVMDTMTACLRAQEKAISEGVLQKNEEWEPIRLIPTKKGADYLKTEDSEIPQYWRLMSRIRRARSYKSLNAIPDSGKRLIVAEEAGRGLALFGVLTAGMNPADIRLPLPGYRNTALYFDQLDSILEGNRTMKQASARMPSDPLLRQSTERFFLVQLPPEDFRCRIRERQVQEMVTLVLEQRSFCMKLQNKLASGDLKTAVVHGDTKLDNFLFSTRTGKVKSLIDLDTVMPHTWLSDWGDTARSLANVSGERERNPDDIGIDMDVFKAVARGYIGSAPQIPRTEVELMVDAARIMALELGVRFLADYLRGDTYFRPGAGDPAGLNRTRATVQLSVFRCLGDRAAEAEQSIIKLYEGRVKDRGSR